MTEAQIQQQILAAFGALPGIRIWRTNTGKAKVNGRWVQFNPPGTPDISGVITVNGFGVALGIEVKSSTGRLRPEQATFQRVYEALGALYIVARSPADVQHAIDAFRARAR